MRKLRIGLDLDGVFYDWEKAMVRVLTDLGEKVELPEKGAPSWDWIEDQVSPAAWRQAWDSPGFLFYDFPLHAEQWKKLAKKYGIHVITSRRKNAASITAEWLEAHKLPYTGLHFLRAEHKTLVDCDVYIDDNPDVVRSAIREKKAAIMWSRPHNLLDWEPSAYAEMDASFQAIRTCSWETAHTFIREIKPLG